MPSALGPGGGGDRARWVPGEYLAAVLLRALREALVQVALLEKWMHQVMAQAALGDAHLREVALCFVATAEAAHAERATLRNFHPLCLSLILASIAARFPGDGALLARIDQIQRQRAP